MRNLHFSRCNQASALLIVIGLIFSSHILGAEKSQKIFFRLTLDLPGRSEGSYCKGDFMVRCGEEILASGEVRMEGLAAAESRVFEREIDLSAFHASGDEIMWRFRGEVYDAKLERKFGPMVMQGEKWDGSLQGVGYHITIGDDGSINTEKKVYRGADRSPGKGDLPPKNPFPSLEGPFSVGVHLYFWVDQDREEMFTKDPADRRHVFVQVWYPAQKSSVEGTAPYVLNPEAYSPSAETSRLSNLMTNSQLKVPLSDDSSQYPVLLFSHGANAGPFSSTFLMEHLASHGYVIFSIGHTFFYDVKVFPDGYGPVQDFFPKMEEAGSQEEGYRRFNEFTHRYRTMPLGQDTQFVLDQIVRLNRTIGEFFFKRLDLDRMGIFGWSMGGVNAAHMCNLDERFKAGINFDGTIDGVVAGEGVRQPFMIMKGARPMPDGSDEEFRTMLEMMRRYEKDFIVHSKQVYRVGISGAGHPNFSDLPLYDEAARGTIDTRMCHEIVKRMTRAFFDRFVKGAKDDDLEKIAASYSEVKFEKH